MILLVKPILKMIATDGQRKPRYTKRFLIQNLKSKIQNGIN
ncbi:hypothetical protein GXM_02422 [Nostoc sphaeroides CCNUC1]|uniref:Uncharacterized protein n=1 Tax=Nostoc sphaeroides CCNUC1 TaxID=2653204 RepID=A0A5P8VX51_9NOSO|nr:hypothetical protein GXM_02422 [Nostoc sphaeroides CCNUC1]